MSGRFAPSNCSIKLEAVLEFPGALVVTTAARKASSIMKFSVSSCGRGAGNISQAAASLPLTAVLKRAIARQNLRLQLQH